MNVNNVVTDNQIEECLMHPMLTCEQISLITGLSMYATRKLRLAILKHFCNDFPYSTAAKVRTDHFLEWYDNPRLTKIYEGLYGIKLSK